MNSGDNGLRESANSMSKGLVFEALRDLKDLDDIVYMAEKSHAESRFSYIDFAPHKVRSIAERAISDPVRHAVMMCWDQARPVGLAYCSIGEYHIGEGTLITTIHNINVLKDLRHRLQGGRVALGLFRGVETWSSARSSKEILFHVTSDADLQRTHKLAKRLGYRFIGGSYAKSIG